ncbi:syntaxin 8 [Emericellopsis cladophorae]|uniref:Syntaxin 8 n=1 Tax=Emericellopsis cladophorae TaxID=2686198 RepID=A0A9P9XYQ7_9HYPO|nr:syntaxin 8 [Emericellopsis cladophorae]KAI6780312.1 syntaxin 8 [Emericellopsis cladophorae]
MSNPNQLFLLADHIKLSLLERQRAQTLHLDDAGGSNQDSHISRSLDQLRDGVTSLEEEKNRLQSGGEDASAITDALPSLQKQLNDLTSQFHGFASPSAKETLTHPNSATLTEDFSHASSTERKASKTVRFSDTPSSPSRELFGPYHDDPEPENHGYADHAQTLDNQQLHQYHSQILDDQDEQLDRLGESIGRQRDLSMQIGDELDSHVAMLDEVESATDRHQSRLDRASRAVNKVARSASDNKQITAIVVLIIILVLLIAILK